MDNEIDIGLKVTYMCEPNYRIGKWDYVDPEVFRGYVSDEELKEIEASKDTPYCTSCGRMFYMRNKMMENMFIV